MYNKALEVLNLFYTRGYVAYIVGGYPRDLILGIKTNDIDICTNAKPKEIMELFDNVVDVGYGSVKIIYKKCQFDVTTFRKDIKYENNRKPLKIKYVDEIKKDLLRRDFTINTICIDKDGKIIDLLSAKEDIDNRLIKTVGNPRYRLKEDSLRILRAIRFAANLNFEIDDKTKYYIKKYGYLLNNLSGSRKREEIDKILTSRNREIGRNLLVEFNLGKYLGINNLNEIVLCDDIIGVWSQLEISTNYPFTKIELDSIKKIRELMKLNINNVNIYKYGLYISCVVGSIKGISYKDINKMYEELPIKTKKDIKINGLDIKNVIGNKDNVRIKDICEDITKGILSGKIENDRDMLLKYIINNY